MVRGLRAILALFFCAALPLAWASEPQVGSFPSLDGTALKALVFQPVGRPGGVVVALHGCGGLYASTGARKGQLNARHQAMAEMLVGLGYAVVFPDSLTPRGVAQLCTQKIGTRAITQTERRRDALAALNWVAAQSWATPSKIALMGWSHGGSAVLATTNGRHSEVAAQAVKAATAIAFYPGCGAARKDNYQPNTPLVLLLGASDDWTAPESCVEFAKSVNAEFHVYPDSFHGFDGPVGRVQLRLDVPNGVHPGQGVHVGPNPQARELAHARVRELLHAAFD
jgi:dienelactone hydrolase